MPGGGRAEAAQVNQRVPKDDNYVHKGALLGRSGGMCQRRWFHLALKSKCSTCIKGKERHFKKEGSHMKVEAM